MKKIITLLLAAILLLSAMLLPACNRENDETGPVEMTDFAGNPINLDRPAQRVISFGAADTSLIVDIGAVDRLVARTQWDIAPILSDLPVLDGFNVNAEEVIALQPDVVFTPPNEANRDVWTQLNTAGIAIVVLDAVNIEDIHRKIDIISQVVGMRSAGNALSGTIRSGLEAVRQIAENEFNGVVPVYIELDSFGGFWTAGGNTFVSEILELVGGRNVFRAQTGAWVTVSDEQIITANPRAIIFSDWGGHEPGIEDRPGWDVIYAVEAGYIFGIDANLLAQAGASVVDLANALIEILLVVGVCPL